MAQSLDRSLREVEVLQAIYGSTAAAAAGEDDADANPSVRLRLQSTPAELEHAQSLLEQNTGKEEDETTIIDETMIPTIALEMNILVQQQSSGAQDTATTPLRNHQHSMEAQLYFGLGPGYPAHRPVSVAVLTARGLVSKASQKATLVEQLQSTAHELVGAEAVLELVQMCQEQLLQCGLAEMSNPEGGSNKAPTTNDKDLAKTFSRRWIWVHHIANAQRKQDIVEEALDYQLGGFLKAGYPGVVVVEGTTRNCTDFCTWIKGNKSRPGGFGRQWGHHVRGEFNNIQERKLPETFVALEEDLSVLASACREYGLEDEFKRFVMQHG